jgi:hypothetical protein
VTQQPGVDPSKSVVAETPSATVTVKKPAPGIQLLGGDEIIQLSLRPSPWCIVLYSGKPLLVLALLTAAALIAIRGQSPVALSIALVVVVLAAFCAVVAATLQWASRIYVLTNRRVLQFSGVFAMQVAECALKALSNVQLELSWYQPMLRLGTIRLNPISDAEPAMMWEHVARPAEVHEILARAIQKAKTG